MSLEVDFDYEAESLANSRQHVEEEYSEECEYSCDCNDEQQDSDDEEDLLDESDDESEESLDDDENLSLTVALAMLAMNDRRTALIIIRSILESRRQRSRHNDSTDDVDDDSVAEFQSATTIARQQARQVQQCYSE